MKSIEIDDASEERLNRLVDSGQFRSPSEVVSVSLRVLDERLAAFRDDVARGMEDYKAGKFSTRSIRAIIDAARSDLERQSSLE
jgi:putative addiction module CopG family antidote